MRLGMAAASAAAVAAALLLAFALDLRPPNPRKAAQLAAAAVARAHANGQKSFWAVPLEVLTASLQEHRDPAIEMVAQEIDELAADMVATAEPSDLGMDRGIDQIQRAVEEFWTDDVFE
jgi:mevalonate pyrophosphate decarboxylase